MFHIIEARHIFANVFIHLKQITVRELKPLASKIMESTGVNVDVSKDSISAALENYPDMFERQDEVTVRRAYCSQNCNHQYVNVFFNQEIPSAIRGEFLNCIASFVLERTIT